MTCYSRLTLVRVNRYLSNVDLLIAPHVTTKSLLADAGVSFWKQQRDSESNITGSINQHLRLSECVQTPRIEQTFHSSLSNHFILSYLKISFRSTAPYTKNKAVYKSKNKVNRSIPESLDFSCFLV